MSRDRQWVMTTLPSAPVQLMLYPTGAGSSRRLDNGEFVSISAAAFLGSGSEIVVCGNEPGKGVRCYVRPVAGGTFKPFTPEGVRDVVASPDGQSIVGRIGDGYREFSIPDGASRSVPGLTRNDRVIRYSADGRSLWTRQRDSQPVRIEQVDLRTGVRSMLLQEFSKPRAGVIGVRAVSLADDPRNYVYIESEFASYLFELKGMR